MENIGALQEFMEVVNTGFPTSHQPRFYAAPNFLKMGIKYLHVSSFWTISTVVNSNQQTLKVRLQSLPENHRIRNSTHVLLLAM